MLPRLPAVGHSLLMLLALAAPAVSSAAVEDEIRARIQPHGEVCVMGDPCAAGLSGGAAAGANAGPKDPAQVYQTYCMACHMAGVANAPILGNKEQWAPRIAKGMDTLYQSAISGFNNGVMPAKGLCMDCSDDDLRATVDHMVQASQ